MRACVGLILAARLARILPGLSAVMRVSTLGYGVQARGAEAVRAPGSTLGLKGGPFKASPPPPLSTAGVSMRGRPTQATAASRLPASLAGGVQQIRADSGFFGRRGTQADPAYDSALEGR